MVDDILARYPDYRKNTPYYIDFIQICLAAKFLNIEEIRELYIDKGFSANQIASRLGVSRTVILSRLHDLGIRQEIGASRVTNPQNYRCSTPPYGFSKRAGKLLPNRSEMKICRLIVEMVQRDGQTHSTVARELFRRGYKNRSGSIHWDSKTVFNIFNRWKDKL